MLKALRSLPIPSADLDKILGGNAAQLLNLAAAKSEAR
jgi:predicted TIM-barrel fold metal-dependent hydrolase